MRGGAGPTQFDPVSDGQGTSNGPPLIVLDEAEKEELDAEKEAAAHNLYEPEFLENAVHVDVRPYGVAISSLSNTEVWDRRKILI